jgi:hypothetical protein
MVARVLVGRGRGRGDRKPKRAGNKEMAQTFGHI